MKQFFCLALFSLFTFPFFYCAGGEKEQFITAEQTLFPYFSPPGLFYGKYFRNDAPVDFRYKDSLRKIAKEPMTQTSFTQQKNAPMFYHFFSHLPPENVRCMIRELELYSGKRNIAAEAKITASSPGGEIRFPERLHDLDPSWNNISYSAPPMPNQDIVCFYLITFQREKMISSLTLKSGKYVLAEGEEKVDKNSTFIHIVSHFSFQKKDEKGMWKDIEGAVVKNNLLPDKNISFPPVKGKEFRLKITAQSNLLQITPSHFTKYSPGSTENIFQVKSSISRYPLFACFENFSISEKAKKEYENWKKEHKNFLGHYVGEWDSDAGQFFHHRKDITKSAKLKHASASVKRKMQEIANLTATRKGAVEVFKRYFDAISRSCFEDKKKLNFIDCCLPLAHYAREWGAEYCIMETTCNGIQRHQAQMYFARGAARQYGQNWGWYIAGTLYSAKKPEGCKENITDPNYIDSTGLAGAGGNGGFSPSMNKRDRYLAWFAGASTVQNESWPKAYCMPGKTKNAPWVLSPHGEVMKEWFSFITKNPERGVSYAPVALAMQWDHGVRAICGSRPFDHYPVERGDMMNEALLRTVVPYKFGLTDQEWGMSETPYGDICDVILPDPPSGPVKMEILKNYRAMILCGSFSPDEQLAARLKEYVKNGGTLAINTKQLGKFLKEDFTGVKVLPGKMKKVLSPILDRNNKKIFDLKRIYEFDTVTLSGAEVLLKDSANHIMMTLHKYGKGHVIFSTTDHLVHKEKFGPQTNFYSVWGRALRFPFMDWLFERFSKELLPIKVEGHIQYGINLVKEGLLVYLFNNEGVHKTAFTPQKIDESKKVLVKLDLKKLKHKGIQELVTGKKLKKEKGNDFISLTVPPGDLRVVKIQCENR